MDFQPKTIQIFLPDGSPKGIKIAEITNRTVQAVLIPRNMLDKAKLRDEVSSVGLYFLFGENEEHALPHVYIGEAENCYERLKNHNSDPKKEFWTEAIIIITNNKQNQFTKTDVKYLENFAYETTKEVGRYSMNQTVPTKSFVPEWRTADLHDIFQSARLLLSTLGHPVFEPVRQTQKSHEEVVSSTFYCKGRGASASGELTSEGFVVHKGSKMADNYTPSFKERYAYHLNTREKLLKDGVVEEINGEFIFMKDYLFNSPSMASCLVLLNASSGLKDWKTADGVTLKEVQQKQE